MAYGKLCVLALLFALPTFTQEYRATLLGVVTDSSGAAVVDAAVAVVIEICIKNATINAKKGEVRIGGCSPVVSLATFESGRWIG